MKLRISIMLLITMLCCATALFAQSYGGEKGDVNNDGTVNILDAIRAVNIILEIQPPPTDDELWAADCNGDDQTNILDALGIVNVILEIGMYQPIIKLWYGGVS